MKIFNEKVEVMHEGIGYRRVYYPEINKIKWLYIRTNLSVHDKYIINRLESEYQQLQDKENIFNEIEMINVKGNSMIKDFYIGKYLVTQKLWQKIMGDNPSYFKGENLPVESVSWNDVQVFLKKLNTRFPGNNYRLPTKAEWEYAARGGKLSKDYVYSGSNSVDEVAWYYENSGNKTHPVGQLKPNELGLYDMSGNVWEWCEDDWHSDLDGIPKNGKAWVDQPERGFYRVARGGSWDLVSQSCRTTYRNYGYSSHRYGRGFRLAHS